MYLKTQGASVNWIKPSPKEPRSGFCVPVAMNLLVLFKMLNL